MVTRGESTCHVFRSVARKACRAHGTILRKRLTVSSLEAALFFAAVLEAQHIHGVDYDLTLLVGPVAGTGLPDGEKTVFIAWQDPGQPWRGFDLSHVTDPFTENVARSSVAGITVSDLDKE